MKSGQQQQNTTAENNKLEGTASYTQVRPITNQEPHITDDDESRVIGQGSSKKVMRPASILPPLTKTQGYEQMESKVTVGPTGTAEMGANGHYNNASISIDAGQDNSMMALKQTYNGQRGAGAIDESGEEAATVSALMMNNDAATMEVNDQANFEYLVANGAADGINLMDLMNERLSKDNQDKEENQQQIEEDMLIEEIIEDEDCRFYFHGKEYQYSRRSLFCFTKHNTFRQSIVWIITHKRFDQFIVSLIIFNSILLGVKDYTDSDNLTTQNQIVERFDSFFTTAFTIECALKVVGMGFILDEGSYLRDEWNWLDFIVVVSSLLTEIPQMKSVSSMRTFRLMRPLRTLTTMPSMKVLISTLLSSVAQLGGVLILAIFFFTIFAILGVSLWSGKIYYRCRMSEFPVNGDWEVDPTDTALCSEERACTVNRYCGSLAVAKRNMDQHKRFYLNPEVDVDRDSMIEELNFSYSSFNHLFAAFLTIFQCITLEGWIDVTNMYRNAYNQGFVQIYFLLCIIVCSFFVLNLTIAVMLLKYEEADNAQDSTHDQELVDYGYQINLPQQFIEFLIEQDNLQISQKAQKMIKNQKRDTNFLRNLIHSDAIPDTQSKYYQNKFTVFFFYLVNSPIFDGLIIFIILLNTIVLATDKYPDWDQSILDFLNLTNTVFTIIFTAEVVFKLIGLGVRGYVSDKFNIFDCLIVIISLLDMIMASNGDSAGGDAFAALRAFRLFRIFKIFRSGDLRTLLDSIAFTVITIKDYAILLGLFIYVFALLGESFFAGKVKFDDDGQYDLENGTPNRINFENLTDACVTVFQVMIGENWNSIMYDHMRSVGVLSCIYFISLVILGNIIMLNLFLAILLGNFDRARNLGEKKKIFDAFNSMINEMDLQLNVAISILFDDADFTRYIEDKVLAINKAKDNEKDEEEQEDEGINFHTNREIEMVYAAMSLGTIEQFLSGERLLEDSFEIPDDMHPIKMTDLQKARTIEILAYIKRQTYLRKQRLLFQEQINQMNEKRQAVSEQAVEEQPTSSDSEEYQKELSILDHLINQFQNSSLLIFPQGSFIRNCCQMCIQQDQEQTTEPKKEITNSSDHLLQKSYSAQGDEASGNANSNSKQINAEEKSGQKSMRMSSMAVQPPKPKRVQKSGSMKEQNSLQIQQLQAQQSSSMLKTGFSLPNQSQKIITTKFMNKESTNNKQKVASIFEGIILSLILISSITLVIDSPLADPEDPIIVFIGYLDNCFTVLFTLEAIIKIIALGFFVNNNHLKKMNFSPYILDPWNILDFIVVCASLIDFIVTIQSKLEVVKHEVTNPDFEGEEHQSQSGGVTDSLQALKALRALRAFRPLRMISRNKGMKLIVNALISSLPSMTNVTIVCLFLLLIFAILGVNFFKGKFQRCSIEDDDSIIDIKTCLAAGGDWVNRDENFDNVLYGTRTLIELMTTEGWVDVMDDGCDGVSPTLQPETDAYKSLAVPYFIVFMIFGSQFILNLFVGVIMDNFNKIKEKEELGSLFVTDDQRSWIDAQRLGLSKKLQKRVDPPLGWRGKMFNLVKHSIFENTITLFIGLNTLVMAIRHDGMPKNMSITLEYMNYVFAFIFNAEMIMKLIGLGYKQYFDDSWNVFDAFVVIATDAGIILNLFSAGASFSTAATVVRAFRIMRIIRLVRKSQNIKLILDTLFNIIPQITNFIGLMFLLLFIYAALGINLFSTVKHQEFINDQDNFQGLGNSIVLLFRCATGENWNKIMHELSRGINDIDCIDDDNSYETLKANNFQCQGCGINFAQAYFMSFTLLISWLIMNLSIAAVIEGLENAKLQNFGMINADNMNNLLAAWMEYDPNATGWISITDFICLIIEQPPPFGNKQLNELCKSRSRRAFVQQKNRMYNKNSFFLHEEKMILIKKKHILKILQAYKIQTYEGKTNMLHFKDIYQILVKKVFKENVDDFEISKYLKRKMKDQWIENYKKFKNMSNTGFKAHQAFASEIITQYARRYKKRKEEQRQADQIMAENDSKSQSPARFDRQSNLQKDNLPDNFLTVEKPKYEIGFQNDYQGSIVQNQSPNMYNGGQVHQTRTRQKNKDENPQEFEEDDTNQDQINNNNENNQVSPKWQGQAMLAEHPTQQMREDSMQANEFNIKMNRSITDSAQNKSEQNLPLISPEQEAIDNASIDQSRNVADLNDNDFSRARSHQLVDPLVANQEMQHHRGSGSMEGIAAQIPMAHQVGEPPKTANEAQNPRQGLKGRTPKQAFGEM